MCKLSEQERKELIEMINKIDKKLDNIDKKIDNNIIDLEDSIDKLMDKVENKLDNVAKTCEKIIIKLNKQNRMLTEENIINLEKKHVTPNCFGNLLYVNHLNSRCLNCVDRELCNKIILETLKQMKRK